MSRHGALAGCLRWHDDLIISTPYQLSQKIHISGRCKRLKYRDSYMTGNDSMQEKQYERG